MPIGERIPTTQVTSGVILYTKVIHTAAGRDLVSILDVDLTNPNIRLGVVQAYNRLISRDSTENRAKGCRLQATDECAPPSGGLKI